MRKHTFSAVQYRPSSVKNEQGYKHIALNGSKETSTTDWQKDITPLKKYFPSFDSFVEMLSQSNLMPNGCLSSINVVQLSKELKKTGRRWIPFAHSMQRLQHAG